MEYKFKVRVKEPWAANRVTNFEYISCWIEDNFPNMSRDDYCLYEVYAVGNDVCGLWLFNDERTAMQFKLVFG